MGEFAIAIPRGVVSALIAYHLAGLGVMNAPDSALRNLLWPYFGPYLDFMGMGQTWNMFSPDPADANVQVEGIVHYEGGGTRRYRFPELQRQGFAAAYCSLGIVKLLYTLPQNTWACPDVAKFIARRCNDRFHLPRQVDLYYLQTLLAPPERRVSARSTGPTVWTRLGSYAIVESDLEAGEWDR
ncbi:MAG: hypothetical protein KGR26_12000 [Cyanobacteria bacterium REEB65]|nr:hypothetical protein [Cyanobacteria bacterium REEB65]